MKPWMMFTKHLEGYDLDQIMDGLHRAGVDGADLCVRPGYPVNPDNAAIELPKAARPTGARPGASPCPASSAANCQD